MFRFILAVIWIVFFFITGIPLILIELIIGKFNKKARDISCLRIVQFILKGVLFIAGTKTTVIGMENIPKGEAVLFVGNHRSLFDVVIAYTVMPGLTGFIGKKELGKVPFLNIWMKFVNCLFLDRHNIREGMKTMLTGMDMVRGGISMTIFPEGTRSESDEMLPFKEGSLKIAEKTGCKIIPMVQNNTESCFEKQSPRLRKTHTVLEFCEPIEVDKLTKEEKKFLGAYVQKIIQNKYEENIKLV